MNDPSQPIRTLSTQPAGKGGLEAWVIVVMVIGGLPLQLITVGTTTVQNPRPLIQPMKPSPQHPAKRWQTSRALLYQNPQIATHRNCPIRICQKCPLAVNVMRWVIMHRVSLPRYGGCPFAAPEDMGFFWAN